MKKANSAEIDRRIHEVVRLITCAKPTSYILRFCSEEFGVTKRQGETYLKRAREVIKADYSIERSEFMASRMALLDKIIDASVRDGQHSNAIGAAKLQCQLARLLEN